MDKLFRKSFYFLFPFIFYNASGQNLLNTNSWQLGYGNTEGAQGSYLANGDAFENWRIMGTNHLGEDTMLWEARNDVASNEDGGWDSYIVPIQSHRTYRFAVWIKKTNSLEGTTYFGVGATPNTILDLNGYPNRDPFFLEGDVPELDKWYLVVSYVFKARQRSSIPELTQEILESSGIFDSETGEKVGEVDYFRFSLDANYVNHKTYLNFDQNISDRQYMYGPRIELVDDRMPTVPELLGVNPDSQLNLFYDLAGNQKTRIYCPNGSCQRRSTTTSNENEEQVLNTEELNEEDKDAIDISKEILIAPNPTRNILNVTVTSDSSIQFSDTMSIHSLNGALLKTFNVQGTTSKMQIDISDLATGTYFLHVHTSEGLSQTKKIIKL